MALVLGIGCVLRLIAAGTLTPHVDETSSVLAAHAVASQGLPILPSGTVYFQGATLSALLTPFVWLGAGELEDLHLMRLVLVIAGTVTVYLGYRLGRAVTGDSRVGIVTAMFMALDPVSVQWSGHVRMYGLLQALTAGLAWAFIALLTKGRSWGRAALVTALFWAAVFTHVGASLLVPAMLLAAWIMLRTSLFQRRDLLGCLALSGLAPLVLLALNELLGTASVGAGGGTSSSALSFVGDNLLQPLARFQVSLEDWEWTMLTRPSTLFWLIPGLIVAISTLAGGRWFLRDQSPTPTRTRQAMIVLLVFYWLPVIAVGVFTVSPKERYLLHVHLLGYVFVGALIVTLARRPGQLASRWDSLRPAVATALTATVALAIGSGLAWRLENPVVHPDYNAAMAYVADHHEPGQPVIVALPAVGYLTLDASSRPDLQFLAGDEDRPRAQRYTRRADDGRLVDYWVGVDSIVTADQLRRVLAEHPNAWIVVDEERLAADWAYAGEVGQLVTDTTEPVYEAPGGALVLRVSSAAGASPD